MITTPAAARDPYIAAAEAPFNISMFCMSSGLISAILFVGLSWFEALPPADAADTALRPAEIEELSTYTPSIIYNGCVLPCIEVAPRNFIESPPPGAPEF